MTGRAAGCDFLNIDANLLPDEGFDEELLLLEFWLTLFCDEAKENVFTSDSPNEENAKLDSLDCIDFVEDELEKMRCEDVVLLKPERFFAGWSDSWTDIPLS